MVGGAPRHQKIKIILGEVKSRSLRAKWLVDGGLALELTLEHPAQLLALNNLKKNVPKITKKLFKIRKLKHFEAFH